MQRIGFAAWAAQAILQIAWHGWLLPPDRMPLVVALLIALIPLALPLIVAGMVSLFYFCHGVTEAWASPAERTLALIEVALALVLIGSLSRKPKRKNVVPT